MNGSDAEATTFNTSVAAPRRRRGGKVRDRVVELVRVRAGDLGANPGNWRRHPERQRAALRGLLRDVGYADALLPRGDGRALGLIDGHLRKSLGPDQGVPGRVLGGSRAGADPRRASRKRP